MATVAAHLEELGADECQTYLAAHNVGRVAVNIAALPAVLPVNYALMEGDIVFRTAPGTKLNAATNGTVVAFEIDETDRATRTGWSVMVVGRASEITDPETLEEARRLDLDPWIDVSGDLAPTHYVRIKAEQVTGRRIVQA